MGRGLPKDLRDLQLLQAPLKIHRFPLRSRHVAYNSCNSVVLQYNLLLGTGQFTNRMDPNSYLPKFIKHV